MKILIAIVFSMLSLSSFAQECDTLQGNPINCTDALGLKQGKWMVFDTISQHEYGMIECKGELLEFKCRSSYCGTTHSYKIVGRSEGLFQDGRKFGKWSIYDCGDLEKQIEYADDGSLTVEHPNLRYQLAVNADTSLIRGTVLRHGDRLEIYCSDNNYTISLANEVVVDQFDDEAFTQLEFELFRLSQGIYDRKIALIKSSR